MRYSLIFSQLASEDLTDILGWYKSQNVVGLDKRFIEDISKSLKRIETNPEAHSLVYKNIRKILLTSFPYKLLYYEDNLNREVHIIGVIHQSRDPKVWKKRI